MSLASSHLRLGWFCTEWTQADCCLCCWCDHVETCPRSQSGALSCDSLTTDHSGGACGSGRCERSSDGPSSAEVMASLGTGGYLAHRCWSHSPSSGSSSASSSSTMGSGQSLSES